MSERRTKMKPPGRLSNLTDSSSSSESTSSFSSEDEETDVRDLKPITDYLNDRRQLAAQLFKSVKLEKIRRMLPQALKKMNLYDLEEFCGSELSGMSRRRILCIINGQRMADSSETDESDNSGPSLEIISDTEEWLTDEDMVIKAEDSTTGKSKSKKNVDKLKGKARPISKDKAKAKPTPKPLTNPGKDNKSADVNVKVEGQKPETKEGETLLDLLELEMRARAIRALIRKEEDIIPGKLAAGTSSEKNDTVPANVNPSVSKYIVQEMQQISVALKQGSGLDDDVMLVIQPAPTIELLSSDSENETEKEKEKEEEKPEEEKSVNQRLENERETKKKEKSNRVNQRLEIEQENEKEDEEENEEIVEVVEDKGNDETTHIEQSKRVNKRLENERGTETTHSTSTIGDEVVEILDNEKLKNDDESPAGSGKNETEFIMEESEKSKKIQEKILDKEADNHNKSEDENPIKTTNEISNKTPEITADGTSDKTSPEKMLDKEGIDKIQDQQETVPDEPEKEEEKRANEPENVAHEATLREKSPDRLKSPEKELEEGELTSDTEEKAPVIDVNIEKLTFNKRVKRKRHMRSKVHESSEESEDLDQSETSGSESKVSDKVKDASKVKSKSRKKIKDLTKDLKAIGSEEKLNESTKDNMQDSVAKKEEEAGSKVENKKEELRKQNALKNKQEDAEKDMEEIIDLDDYSDDMDDMENNEKSKSVDLKKSDVITAPDTSAEKSEPSETWASRYYNTDDVQNVIKESKIHSEIRKRLRERQRICKLSSPNTRSNSPSDIKVEEAKQKPLGSVEEYLALKAAAAATAAESALNEKTEDLPEKSKKSSRRNDPSRKSKSHTSKKRSKSDKKSSKDDATSRSTRKKKERDTMIENSEVNPD